MRVLAIDPGPEESAFVVYDGERVLDHAKVPNVDMLALCCQSPVIANFCVIEKIASFGMPVGAEVFETVFWSGRFAQAFDPDGGCHRITRIAVKSNLCHSAKAKDGNIRQAIIDRFGGKDAAIGRKATPGPLFGITADQWSALAVALTWWDHYQVVS